MIRRYHRLVAYLGERESGEALALFRMMVGLALLVDLGATGMHGVLDAIWIDAASGGYRPLAGNHVVQFLGGPKPEVVWSLFWVTIASGFALVLGLGGRFTALLAAQGLLALSGLNGHARGSYDALLSNCLWLLVLANSTATWSLDARLRRGTFTPDDTQVTAWPRRVGILQLVIVYFATGIQKISAHWTPAGGFSALYFILQQPNWHRFDMGWIAYVYPLTQIGTALVWAFELGAPFLLFALYRERKTGGLRWVRFAFVGFGVALHTGVLLLMEVGPFTVIIWSLYFCLFRPAEVRRLIGAWSRRAGARSYSST